MDFGAGLVCIRAMTGADLERVVEIASGLETAPQWSRAAYEAAYGVTAAGMPLRIALVAELNGAVIGFVVTRVVAGVAEIESIAVVREVQRRGVGVALLAEAVERLKAAGITEIDLEVRESNRAAAAL